MNKRIKISAMRWVQVAILGACVFAASMASALTIEQALLLPDPDGVPSFLDDFPAGTETAETFVVTTPIDVQNISWWGSYDPDVVADDFIVRVFLDNFGLPDNVGLLYEAVSASIVRTATGELDFFGADVYEYSHDIALGTLVLNPGTYWLSVVNVSNVDPDFVAWYWAQSVFVDDTNAYREVDLGDDWTLDVQSIDVAYRITGESVAGPAVPVPATWLLMAVPAVLIARRRKH